MSEVLSTALRLNLVAAGAILAVLALRLPVRRVFGARLAYWLWLVVPVAAAAALAPARMAPVMPSSGPALPAAPVAETLAMVSRIAPVSAEPYLLAAWMAGVLLALGFAARNQHRFLALASRSLAGPAVVGFLAPRLVLPADFESRFTPDERQVILAHEAVHLRRGDSRINTAVLAVQCLCWFNPLIHMAAHLLRMDQELSCDAAVVSRLPSQRRAYAEALLKTQLASASLPAGCYWPSRATHPLNKRIAMLKSVSPSSAHLGAGAALLVALNLASGLTAWAAQPARPAPPPSANLAASIALPAVSPVETAPSKAAVRPRARPAPSGVIRQTGETQAPLTPVVTDDMVADAINLQREALTSAVTLAVSVRSDKEAEFDDGRASRTDVVRAAAELAQAKARLQSFEMVATRYEYTASKAKAGLVRQSDLIEAERAIWEYLR